MRTSAIGSEADIAELPRRAYIEPVSRLHAILADARDIAAHFRIDPVPAVEHSVEVVEGNRGLVVRESHGRRVLQTMTWGFPRIDQEMRDRGEDVGRIGLVADLTNSFWEGTVVEPRYRCLIVLTHFANPDGPGLASAVTRASSGQSTLA